MQRFLRRTLFAAFLLITLCVLSSAVELKLGVGTVKTENGLCLRSKPVATADCKMIAANGDTVIVISKTDDWYLVKYNLVDGYMKAEYVDFTSTDLDRNLGKGMTITACYLRSAPVETASPVRLMPSRATVTVNGIQNGWYAISYNGATGFARSDLINMTEKPAQNTAGTVVGTSLLGSQAVNLAEQMLGCAYVYGSKNPAVGFDCSGLISYVAGQLGFNVGRTAQSQAAAGSYVSYDNLQPGDLVFFTGTYYCGDLITHVGIYVGNGQFVHAAGNRVQTTSLSNAYYAARYYTARRVFV
ncbi:MAG: C40 family peptidase [Oscillospiraceae bacterium]|nr:C40 family peptidase [Oscillospiraceae bacterium]